MNNWKTRTEYMDESKLWERFSIRFKTKCGEPDDKGCIPWLGSTYTNGYPRVSYRQRYHPAHRMAWFIQNGTNFIPEEIDHICNNRNCVNPSHLRPVTHRENMEHQWYGDIR